MTYASAAHSIVPLIVGWHSRILRSFFHSMLMLTLSLSRFLCLSLDLWWTVCHYCHPFYLNIWIETQIAQSVRLQLKGDTKNNNRRQCRGKMAKSKERQRRDDEGLAYLRLTFCLCVCVCLIRIFVIVCVYTMCMCLHKRYDFFVVWQNKTVSFTSWW